MGNRASNKTTSSNSRVSAVLKLVSPAVKLAVRPATAVEQRAAVSPVVASPVVVSRAVVSRAVVSRAVPLRPSRLMLGRAARRERPQLAAPARLTVVSQARCQRRGSRMVRPNRAAANRAAVSPPDRPEQVAKRLMRPMRSLRQDSPADSRARRRTSQLAARLVKAISPVRLRPGPVPLVERRQAAPLAAAVVARRAVTSQPTGRMTLRPLSRNHWNGKSQTSQPFAGRPTWRLSIFVIR